MLFQDASKALCLFHTHFFPGSCCSLRAAICLHLAGSLQVGFFDLRSKPEPQSKLIQLSLVLSFQSLLPSVPPQTSPHTFSFQRRLLVSVVKKSNGSHPPTLPYTNSQRHIIDKILFYNQENSALNYNLTEYKPFYLQSETEHLAKQPHFLSRQFCNPFFFSSKMKKSHLI